jgi:hypothetical protein
MNMTQFAKKAQREWSRIAKEDIVVQMIAGTCYGFGSELACLRLFQAYHKSGDKVKAGFSTVRNEWFFRMELN